MDTPYCTLFLCLLFHAAAANPAPVDLTAAVGQAVIFPLEIPKETNFDNIIWISQSRQKAVAMILPGQPLNVLLPELWGRLTTSDQHYSLKISNLTMRDGGLYIARMTTPSDTIQLKQYWLHVYEIVVNANRWASGTCSLRMNCTAGAGSADRVTFSWTDAGKAGASPVQGSILQLLLEPADKHLSYTCTAQTSHNHSSQSTTVIHYEFCSERAGTASHAGPAWITTVAITLALIVSLLPPRATLRCKTRD